MFNSITGTITAKFPKQLFLESNGIEWDISMPDSNLDVVGNVGNSAKVFTYLQHTENAMCLFGFSSSEERSIFFDLLKVDGVGPKGAVKIMSSVNSERLNEILESGDVGLLEKIPGVGKKTAGKMMLALKGKLTLSSNNNSSFKSNASNPFQDVILSLVTMGYDKKLAEEKVSELLSASENDLAGKSQKEKEDYIFRKAIMALS